MSIFLYKARDKRDQLVEGVIDAVSENAVAVLLAEKGLSPIEIKKQLAEDFERQILGKG
jgi:type II secretory pathway component PulF